MASKTAIRPGSASVLALRASWGWGAHSLSICKSWQCLSSLTSLGQVNRATRTVADSPMREIPCPVHLQPSNKMHLRASLQSATPISQESLVGHLASPGLLTGGPLFSAPTCLLLPATEVYAHPESINQHGLLPSDSQQRCSKHGLT